MLDYLDDELAEDERRLIENHLDACAACRKKVEGYKNAFEMLDQWQPPPPSEGFEERVLQRLRSLPMPKKPIWQRILDMFNGEVNQETPVRADAVAFPRHWQPVAAMAVLLIAAPIFTYYVMKGPDVTDRNREMPPIIIGTETKPISIVIKNPERNIAQLIRVAKSHGGRLTLSTPAGEQGTDASKAPTIVEPLDLRSARDLVILPGGAIRIVAKVPPKNERAFVNDLSTVGKIREGLLLEDADYKNFKDAEGNIIIFLERK